MPSAGNHLASIEMRVKGTSFEHMPAVERLKQLEKELDLEHPSDMSIKKRIQRIETETTSMGF